MQNIKDIEQIEDLHLYSSEEDLKKTIDYIEKIFSDENNSKNQYENLVKLSNFLKKNNIKIGELESEKLLDKSEKLNKTFYALYLANLLTRINRLTNLIDLLELYCIRNGYEQQTDIDELLYEGKNKDLDILKIYLNEIGQYKLLTREEEIQLVNQGEKGRIKLIEHNLRLAVSIAKKYRGQGVSFEDLIQSANEGIITASRKFDASKGCKFSTYATWWSKQRVQREIAESSRAIKIPYYIHEDINKLKKALDIYQKENNGKMPSDKELMELIGVNEENYQIIKTYMNTTLSLSTPLSKDDSSDGTLGDLIEDDNFQIDKEINKYYYEGFNKLFMESSSLDERDREILKRRFGFYGRVYNLEEVGKILGLSKERVRQLEHLALRKLRLDKNITKYASPIRRFGRF